MLFTAPGKTSQIPTVATVSIDPVDRAAFSTARISSDAAHSASRRSGITTAARVPSRAFDRDSHAGWRRDLGHNSERHALSFQKRPLLDVQFHPRFVIPARQWHILEFAGHPGRTPHFVHRRALSILQLARSLRRKTVPKASGCRCTRSRTESALPTSAAAVQSNSAAEIRSRCSARIASSPPSTPTTPSYFPAFGIASMCEPVPTTGASGSDPFHLANVLPIASYANRKPRLLAARPQPRARFQIRRRENNSSDGRRLGVRNRGQLVDLARKLVLNQSSDVIVCYFPASGCRFQSL